LNANRLLPWLIAVVMAAIVVFVLALVFSGVLAG